MANPRTTEQSEARKQILDRHEAEQRKTTSLRLKTARIQRGMKQKELALHVGVSEGTYSRYEKGTHQIPNERLDSLANVLGVKVMWLMGYGAMSAESDVDMEDQRSGLRTLSLAAIYGEETGNEVLDVALRAMNLLKPLEEANAQNAATESVLVSFRLPKYEKEHLLEMAALSGLGSQDLLRLAIKVLKEVVARA